MQESSISANPTGRPKKSPSEKSFLSQIVNRIEERLLEECLSEDKIWETIEYRAGWIEIYMASDGTVEVGVYHSGNEHKSLRIETTIAGMLPDWYSVHSLAIKELETERKFKEHLWNTCRYM